LPKVKKINGLSHINPTVISNKFHINLQVPSGYAYVLQKQFYVVEKRDYWWQHQSFNLSSAFECD
jgi:hypothetical protein